MTYQELDKIHFSLFQAKKDYEELTRRVESAIDLATSELPDSEESEKIKKDVIDYIKNGTDNLSEIMVRIRKVTEKN